MNKYDELKTVCQLCLRPRIAHSFCSSQDLSFEERFRLQALEKERLEKYMTMNKILRKVEVLRKKGEWNEEAFHELYKKAKIACEANPSAMKAFLGQAKLSWLKIYE